MGMATRQQKSISHLKDLTPDPRNARRHTPRNVGMIEKALHEVGAARSIVVDEDGVILAGNATIEAAAAAGIEKVQIVDADGETIIAVRRSGLTPEQKKKLALYDNRTAELAEWDADMLGAVAKEVDLSSLFTEGEVASLVLLEKESMLRPVSDERKLGDPAKQIRPVLYCEEIALFERALRATGEKNRGQAVLSICREYLEHHGAEGHDDLFGKSEPPPKYTART